LGRRNAEVVIVVSLLVTALLGSSCASGQPTVSAPARTTGPAHVLQPIPPTALPGNSADPTDLDATSIATDAVDVAALEALLDQAGFIGGTQRQFSRVHGGRRRILARVIAFETPDGASTYVAWLRDHGDEVIGKAIPSTDLRVPRHGVVLVHEPNPCCHNETRMFLAMWHEGSTVVTIQIAGEGARETDVPELLSQLDAAV
jgi:hypothetical protein